MFVHRCVRMSVHRHKPTNTQTHKHTNTPSQLRFLHHDSAFAIILFSIAPVLLYSDFR